MVATDRLRRTRASERLNKSAFAAPNEFPTPRSPRGVFLFHTEHFAHARDGKVKVTRLIDIVLHAKLPRQLIPVGNGGWPWIFEAAQKCDLNILRCRILKYFKRRIGARLSRHMDIHQYEIRVDL